MAALVQDLEMEWYWWMPGCRVVKLVEVPLGFVYEACCSAARWGISKLRCTEVVCSGTLRLLLPDTPHIFFAAPLPPLPPRPQLNDAMHYPQSKSEILCVTCFIIQQHMLQWRHFGQFVTLWIVICVPHR